MRWFLQFGYFPDAHMRDPGVASAEVVLRNTQSALRFASTIVPGGILPPSPAHPQGGQASIICMTTAFEPSQMKIWGRQVGKAEGFWIGSDPGQSDFSIVHTSLAAKHIGFYGSHVGEHQNVPQMSVEVISPTLLIRAEQQQQLQAGRYEIKHDDTFILGPSLLWVKMIVVN